MTQPQAIADVTREAFQDFFEQANPEQLHRLDPGKHVLLALMGGMSVDRVFEWAEEIPRVGYSVYNRTRTTGILNGGLRREPQNMYGLNHVQEGTDRIGEMTAYVLFPENKQVPSGLHILSATADVDLLFAKGRRKIKFAVQTVSRSVPSPSVDTLARPGEEEPLLDMLEVLKKYARGEVVDDKKEE